MKNIFRKNKRKKINKLDEKMFYKKLFNFAYRDNFIPQMIGISKKIGRDKLVEILTETSPKACSQENVMRNFNLEYDDVFWSNVIKQEIIKSSEDLLEIKITECLWAKVFKDANATDIGYAALCNVDFATAQAKGQKLVRTKTLMQGDDCCNHCWTTIK